MRLRRHHDANSRVDSGIKARHAIGSPRAPTQRQVLVAITDKETRVSGMPPARNEQLGLAVSELDLVGDDYSVTQAIASAARDAGFDGVLAPAAALPGRKTLAVSAHALSSVIFV